VAQINVGAATETEMKERKALIDDAKSAVQAALAEGVVPGGGVALLRSEKAIESLAVSGDEKFGASIVKNALKYPLEAIAENAGVDGSVVVNRVRRLKGKNEGYDADKGEYGDLVAAGVIDPAKVVRTALQNAASVAALLLTTDSLITEIPKEEEEPAGDGHDHHGMGGGMPGMGGMGGMGGMPGMGGMGGMPGMM
jgi:chaperonin GroEL